VRIANVASNGIHRKRKKQFRIEGNGGQRRMILVASPYTKLDIQITVFIKIKESEHAQTDEE
jgi:hypothetical protein